MIRSGYLLAVFVLGHSVLHAADLAARPPAFGLAAFRPLPAVRSSSPDAAAQSILGGLPLWFEKDPRASRFQARAEGRTVLLEPGRIRISLGPVQRSVTLRFQGSSGPVAPRGEDATGAYTNYFLGNPAGASESRREHFEAVHYDQVWPGVDVRVYGHGPELEYDFHLAPHADPARIRLETRGARSLRIDRAGDLWIAGPDGRIRHRKPVLYQEIDGRRMEIAGGYRTYSQNTVGFWLGSYDPSRPLIIDPVLEYGTYLGGQGSDFATGMTTDSSGNIYVTGYTQLADPFSTAPNPGAFTASQTSRTQDAFLLKLDAGTKKLVYIDYYGGSSVEEPYSVAVDKTGAATIVGMTSSSDLPVNNGFIKTHYLLALIGTYGFAARFSADGSQLSYGTYTGPGVAYGVAVNSVGDTYVVGGTYCLNNPQLVGPFYHEFTPGSNAFQSTCNDPGGEPPIGFLVRLATGGALEYATYYSPSIGLSDVTLDSQENVYLAGTADGATLTGPNNTRFDLDCYVARLDRGLGSQTWGKSVGATGDEECFRIAVDPSGNPYATGYTTSPAFPVTSGAVQSTIGSTAQIPNTTSPFYGPTRPLFDAIAIKLDSNSGQLLYGTFLGGNGDDYGVGIAVDKSGNAYLTGYTNSLDFAKHPGITPGAYQTAYGGGASDAFLIVLSTDGKTLLNSSYLGGAGQDIGYQVALDKDANLWVAGGTNSVALGVTSDAVSQTPKGIDAFVVKLNIQACQAVLNKRPLGTVPFTTGSVTIGLTSDTPSCPWTFSSLSDWITLSPASGAGPSSNVQLKFAANPASLPRVGTFLLNGRRAFVYQDGQSACRFVLTPSELAVTGNSEVHTLNIQASDQTCSWTAQSTQPWLSVVAPASGAGSGSVTVKADPNPGGTPRTAAITVGVDSVPVGQAAGQCAISLSSSSGTLGPAGGLDSVSILATASNCAWTASVPSQFSWISILVGTSGYGSGKIRFAVAQNTTGQFRTGAIAVNGQNYQVNQDSQFTDYRNQTPGSQVTSATTPSFRPPGLGPLAAREPDDFRPHANLNSCNSQKPSTPIQLDAKGTGVTVPIVKKLQGCTGNFDPYSNLTWLHVTLQNWPNSSSDSSKPAFTISADANSGSAQRQGTFTFPTGDGSAGTWSIEVAQSGSGVPVALALTPQSPAELSANAGTTDVIVQPADGSSPCNWSLNPPPGWVHPDTMQGACNSTIHVNYDANPAGTARTATMTFNTQDALDLTQVAGPQPCTTVAFGQGTAEIPSQGGNASFDVTASPANCTWTVAVNPADWITFPNGANGTGSQSITVSATPNATSSQKTAKLSIGDDQAVAYVMEDPLTPCAYTLAPTSASFDNNAASGSFQVQTASTCAWQATAPTLATWLHLAAGSSGTGNGTVNFTVDANPAGGTARLAIIGVAGQSFTVNQSAPAAACTYTLAPPGVSIPASSASGNFQVQTAATCAWQASVPASSPWLHITSGASGTGPGTVAYSVDANSGPLRTGSITVQDQSFSVSQAAVVVTPFSTITANPNPITSCNAQGLGKTTITWSTNVSGTIEVHIGSITGGEIATGASGSVDTGEWFSTPSTIYLISNGVVLTQVTVTTTCGNAANLPSGTLTAAPNPVTICAPATTANVTLTWTTQNVTAVEVHQDSFSGKLVASGGPSGSATVAAAANTNFFLVNTSGGAAPTSAGVLATATVTAGGSCTAGVPPPATDLAESTADWAIEFLAAGAPAQGGALDVNATANPDLVLSGALSMYLYSETADQIRITRSAPTGGWDFSKISTVGFSLETEVPAGDWKSASPSIRLISANGSLTLSPSIEVARDSEINWVNLVAPLAGNSIWQAAPSGQFDIRTVTAVQVSFATTITGWDMIFDSMFLK